MKHITMFYHDGEGVAQVVTCEANKASLELLGFVDSADKVKVKRKRKAKVSADESNEE